MAMQSETWFDFDMCHWYFSCVWHTGRNLSCQVQFLKYITIFNSQHISLIKSLYQDQEGFINDASLLSAKVQWKNFPWPMKKFTEFAFIQNYIMEHVICSKTLSGVVHLIIIFTGIELWAVWKVMCQNVFSNDHGEKKSWCTNSGNCFN